MSKEFIEAIRGGDTARAEAMLAADPALANAHDETGVSAVLWAYYSGQPQLAKTIAARKPELDMFEASVLGDVARVRALLDADAELVKAFSADGWTPLHLAAFFGQREVVELLLEHGALLETKSRNGLANTPLNAAVASNKLEIVRLLLKRGADPNTRQHNSVSPLHAAAFNGNLEMVELLLSYHSDPLAHTDDDRTPAGMAEEKGHHDLADLLRERAKAGVV